jgi:hypothetical protein
LYVVDARRNGIVKWPDALWVDFVTIQEFQKPGFTDVEVDPDGGGGAPRKQASVLITWIFQHTAGSILFAILIHWLQCGLPPSRRVSSDGCNPHVIGAGGSRSRKWADTAVANPPTPELV